MLLMRQNSFTHPPSLSPSFTHLGSISRDIVEMKLPLNSPTRDTPR